VYNYKSNDSPGNRSSSTILLSMHGVWIAWSTYHPTEYMTKAGERNNNIKYKLVIMNDVF